MKSLRPHLYRYVPKYFAKKYPKYVSLMENFLIFLETKNSLNFFDGTTERDHSIYNNIVDFDKHAQIDNLPVKNKDILNAYFKEYATTLDFRNQVLSFDEETMRMLAKFSGMIFNTKSSWSSYNLLFAIISTYLFNGAERGVVFKTFFNEDLTFDTEDAPDFYDIITVSDITKFSYSDFIKNAGGAYGFVKLIDTTTNQIYVDTYNGTFTTGDSLFNLAGVLLDAGITVDNSDSIGRNEIILSEYPLYKINIGFDGVEVDKNVITGKGTRPFEYQLISKSDLFVSGNFVSKLKTGFNPAGFKNEIIYVPEDIECETYYDSKIFPKIKLDIETYDVIAIVTINTPTLTAGVEGNITGTSNGVEVDVYYRVSSPEGAWQVFEEGVAVSGGNWSATGTIADADTYDFKVEDTTDRDGSAQVDDVVVATGVVLTALQITNATTATANIIRPSQLVKDGDDLYVQFYTFSDKINIKGTDYATGGSASAPVIGILKTNITHDIKWVKFFSLFSTAIYMPSNFMCVTASNVYVLSQTYPSSKVNTTVNRLSKTDGSTVNSLALDMERSQAWGTCIGEHSGSIWVVGQVLELYDGLDRHSIRTWELATDLSSQTKRTPGYALNNYTPYGKIINGKAYIGIGEPASISVIDLTTNTAGAITNAGYSGINIGINGDGKPLFSRQDIGTNRPIIERRSADLTSVTGTLNPLVDIAWNMKYRASVTYGTDGYYWILHNDGTKFMIGKVTDNESNPLTLTNTHNLTPDSVSYMSTGWSDIVETSTHIFIIATLTGNYESGFTPGDATKTDTILLAVEK